MDDDNFIDDSGVVHGYYASDNEPRSPGDAPQVGELFLRYFSCLNFPEIRSTVFNIFVIQIRACFQ